MIIVSGTLELRVCLAKTISPCVCSPTHTCYCLFVLLLLLLHEIQVLQMYHIKLLLKAKTVLTYSDRRVLTRGMSMASQSSHIDFNFVFSYSSYHGFHNIFKFIGFYHSKLWSLAYIRLRDHFSMLPIHADYGLLIWGMSILDLSSHIISTRIPSFGFSTKTMVIKYMRSITFT